ncbi:hypothetical protein M2G82_20125 [Vibrio vulnificus]|nr:hypothetical protein [Vibrio vulnificus]
MTYRDEDQKLAKAQAREIWKILDYVRGATTNKGTEPNRLGVFRTANPNALWDKDKKDNELIGETFRCCGARYQETQQQLRTDQGNLCAYCEQDLLSGTNGVPHRAFSPKIETRVGRA